MIVAARERRSPRFLRGPAPARPAPAAVFEGRFGLFALHRQDETAQKDFARIDGELGTVWESRRGSFKPFPAAHVIHPYLDAILRLRREHGINPAAVARIVLPIAPYISADRASRRPRSAGRAPISIAASACSARSTRRTVRTLPARHSRSTAGGRRRDRRSHAKRSTSSERTDRIILMQSEAGPRQRCCLHGQARPIYHLHKYRTVRRQRWPDRAGHWEVGSVCPTMSSRPSLPPAPSSVDPEMTSRPGATRAPGAARTTAQHALPVEVPL